MNENVDGKKNIAGIRRSVIKIVEIASWYFNTFPTVLTVTVKKWAQSTDKNEATIPTLVIISGK